MKTTLFLLFSIYFSVCMYASQNEYITAEEQAILESNWGKFQIQGNKSYSDCKALLQSIQELQKKLESLEKQSLYASFFQRAKISIQMNITKRRLTRLQKRLMPVNIQYQSFRCTQFALQSIESFKKKLKYLFYQDANFATLTIAKQYEKNITEHANFLNNLSESQINKTKKYEEKLAQYKNDIKKSKEDIATYSHELKDSFQPNKIKPRGKIVKELTKSSLKLAFTAVKDKTYQAWNINQKTYSELQLEKTKFNIAVRLLKSLTKEQLESLERKESKQGKRKKTNSVKNETDKVIEDGIDEDKENW